MASVTALSHPGLLAPSSLSSLRHSAQREISLKSHRNSRRSASLACRSSLSSVPTDQSLDAHSAQSLDQEWVSLGLSYLNEDGGSKLDEEWLRLGLTFPATTIPTLALTETSPAHLDAVWLELGLTFTDVELPTLQQEPEGALPGALQEVKEAQEASAAVALQEAPAVEVDPSTYFASDLRPIVLFDGACNFCSKWTVFLLDHDPHGNLRFASMQSEAGKALLKRAAMKATDTSEIVLAGHKRSFIGEEAVLQIFSRLSMPFPAIAMLGFITPRPLSHAVYKLVSKYRHKFGGPSACRLFDPRFNERFVS